MSALPVVLMTDYGLADEFVGVLHRVIAAVSPASPRIDLTHLVPAHDVRAGALTLWRALPWMAPAVVLAVVDPGVGTSRRAIAIEAAGARVVLVGPDNGLLLPATRVLGGVARAVELAPAQVRAAAAAAGATTPPGESERGRTFDGRDLFAPAAALLAAGAGLASVGRDIDAATIEGSPIPEPRRRGGVLEGEVLWIDRFGNAQLNLRPADVEPLGPELDVRAGRRRWTARRAASFAELADGEIGLVTDSYGMLAISANCSSAAARLGLHEGSKATLARPSG